MTKKQMEKTVIPEMYKVLGRAGWFCVRNRKSGLFWRDGYLLCIGNSDSQLDYEEGCVFTVIHEYKSEEVNLRASNWFLEHNGVIVGIGTLQNAVYDVMCGNKSDYSEDECIRDFVRELDSLVERNENGQVYGRIKRVTSSVNKPLKTFVHYNGPLRDTTMFRVVHSVGGMEAGVYKITAVQGNEVEFITIDIDKSIDSVVLVDDRKSKLPWELLKKMIAMGVAEAVSVESVMQPVEVKILSSIDRSEDYPIPDRFLKFGLDRKQLELLGAALAECANVTPFLNRNCRFEEGMVSALKYPCFSLDALSACSFGTSVSRQLSTVMRNQLSIRQFLSGVMDSDYLGMQISDADHAWEDYRISNNIKSSETYEARILHSYGHGISAEHPILEQLISFAGDRLGILAIAETLLQNGFRNGNGYSVPWTSVSKRDGVFPFFAFADLSVSDRVIWNDALAKLLENAQYFGFDTKIGFYLQTSVGKIGRDYNGIVAYYGDGVPRWRAVRVGEENFVYGDISFTDTLCDYFNKW